MRGKIVGVTNHVIMVAAVAWFESAIEALAIFGNSALQTIGLTSDRTLILAEPVDSPEITCVLVSCRFHTVNRWITQPAGTANTVMNAKSAAISPKNSF